MNFDCNGFDMYYETHGDGPPLLWLHGGMGCGDDWRYIFDSPPSGFRLIAPDQRGHGASTNPSGIFKFCQAGADVLALLDHLGIDRVKAIGLSGGGIALLHAAIMQPHRFDAIIPISVPPRFPEQCRAIQRQFSAAMLPPAEMERLRKRCQRGQPQIDELFAYARSFAGDYDDVNFTPTDLARITAETLIVFGDRDPLYPVSLATELYAAIPRAYLWIVPNGGHGPVFRGHAPRFVETALAFLRGDWKGSSPLSS